MKSIRSKITILTVCAIIIAMTSALTISLIVLRNFGTDSSEQILSLLCETGEKNLDLYFNSVEQSADMVSEFVKSDLKGVSDQQLEEHIQHVSEFFEKTANKTNGILTYYYRIDPDVSEIVKGFWYINGENGFVEHEVTDISLYDTTDTSSLVWFTVPKTTGKSIWLPPYITENLDKRVISYNVPIYFKDQFIGVVGIEIDYLTLAAQVDSIKLYENGYALIIDNEGNIIYHPKIEIVEDALKEKIKVPEVLLGDEKFIKYSFNGVNKQASCLPMKNGMRLIVTVPVSEINGNWHKLVWDLSAVSALLLVVFILLTRRLSRHITKPLHQLTDIAEQVDDGNYDVKIDYEGKDEVGILSRAFSKLVKHLRIYINDLNSLAYEDALTSVQNKGAFDIKMNELQSRLESSDKTLEFAVAVFDCDDLKKINDVYGHDKGDIYLKTASSLICSIFKNSPVYRTGGDEFASILQNEDYDNRDELVRLFFEKSEEISKAANEPWEKACVSLGAAVFDPDTDILVNDVARRADKQMYENKFGRKHKV